MNDFEYKELLKGLSNEITFPLIPTIEGIRSSIHCIGIKAACNKDLLDKQDIEEIDSVLKSIESQLDDVITKIITTRNETLRQRSEL